MITASAKGIGKTRMLGFAMLLVVVVFVVLSLIMGSAGYAEVIAMGALFGGGIASLLNAQKVKKRYTTYFESGNTKTILELSNELGVKEKEVRTNLQVVVSRADRKSLKTCESVKFEA